MDWLRRAMERGATLLDMGSTPRAGSGEAYTVAAGRDPWLALHDRFADPETWNQLFVGIAPDTKILTTAPESHGLILGPPRSLKSAGELVPMILFANGPVVSTSTKRDIFRATAMARSRKGRLWHFAPDGSPPLPGTIPLHWSPIFPSEDWASAIMLGQQMAATADVAGGTNDSGFFRLQAGEVTAALLHAAAIGEKSMEWILEAVAENEQTLKEAEAVLRRAGADPRSYSGIAADKISALMKLDGRSRGAIIATTSNCFSAYRLPGALETTRVQNFDEYEFVAGQPDAVNRGLFTPREWKTGSPEEAFGLYDTIYITANADFQAFAAPLVVGLLSRIRQARYQLFGNDDERDFQRPPTFFALDEVANIAPLPELPKILAEGSSQGLLACCVMQDLSQAEARWKDHYKGFLTLFREVVAFPGIRNQETLDALSTLSGEVWEEQFSGSINWNKKTRDPGQSETVSEHRRVRFSPSEIYRGAAEDEGTEDLDNRRMFVMASTGQSEFVYSAPYFFSPPVSEALVGVVENIVEHAPRGDWRLLLPLPKLQPKMMATPGIERRWLAALQGLKWVAE